MKASDHVPWLCADPGVLLEISLTPEGTFSPTYTKSLSACLPTVILPASSTEESAGCGGKGNLPHLMTLSFHLSSPKRRPALL